VIKAKNPRKQGNSVNKGNIGRKTDNIASKERRKKRTLKIFPY
jgi:hypothetical protein